MKKRQKIIFNNLYLLFFHVILFCQMRSEREFLGLFYGNFDVLERIMGNQQGDEKFHGSLQRCFIEGL